MVLRPKQKLNVLDNLKIFFVFENVFVGPMVFAVKSLENFYFDKF
jgi:hypothetical protein